MASKANIVNNGEELKFTDKSLVWVKTYGRILGKYALKFTKKAMSKTFIKAPKVVLKFTKRLVVKRKFCKTKKKHPKFSNCVIKVNTDKPGWQKSIDKILASAEGNGAREGDIDAENGYVRFSSVVDVSTILRALRKVDPKAKLCRLRFGDCSSNFHGLNLPENKPKESPPKLNGNTTDNQTVRLSGGLRGLKPANTQVRADHGNNWNGAYNGYGNAMPYAMPSYGDYIGYGNAMPSHGKYIGYGNAMPSHGKYIGCGNTMPSHGEYIGYENARPTHRAYGYGYPDEYDAYGGPYPLYDTHEHHH